VLARERPKFGYRQMTRLLRLEGFRVRFKRIQRIWRAEGLKVRRKPKKRRAKGQAKNACSRLRAQRANHIWCWDFIFDRTTNGQSLKWLSIVDESTRRCVTLDVSQNMTSEDVINRMAELFVIYGVPQAIRSDNGPEGAPRLAGPLGGRHAVHRAGQSLAERIRRELSQSTAR
jgi:transposase InsO family protein